MARGPTTHAPSPVAASLPKVEYELAKDDVFKLPAGVFDGQARGYGYNDFSEFRRPEYYIRHVEPLESDLVKTVEYDMDEQDQEWLEMVNTDRKKEQLDKVTCEAFEIIMDRLEKEWFDLTKNIPKLDFSMPSEDSTCAICDDSEGENSNAIVFCDGCNLAVHQDCYGVPYIPEGQWLCRKCTVLPENTVDCILCPNEGGAFKQTVDGVWVHLLCAIWVPETRVVNEVFMEPIAGLERISKGRWKLRCEICGIKGQGACIQCTKPSCFVAFHTTCARKEKLLMPMKSAHGAEPASLTAYCDKHLPPEQQEIRLATLEAEENSHSNTLTTKSARAYAKTYKLGPPLVPAIVVDRILTYTARIKIRKKTEFVQQMCRYWSLKREARRGAPLLKRLHLEPWTASGSGKALSEEEKVMKLDQLKRLKQDLVVVRELADLVKKRETRKLRQAEIIYGILSQALFSHYGPLRHVFEKIMMWDRHDYFKNPVSKQEVPDYFEVIKNPMCWEVIDTKLDHHQYWDIQDYFDDIDLVLDNAMVYNKDGTPLFKLAQKIKKDSRALFSDLERSGFCHEHPVLPTPIIHEENFDAEQEDNDTLESLKIGNLEPTLESLELFTSSVAIRELNMELDGSMPVASLFRYELAKMKPPPPESEADKMLDGSMESTHRDFTGTLSGGKKGRKAKPKRDRKAEAERARLNKLAREEAIAAGENAEMREGPSEHDAPKIDGTDEKGKQMEREFQGMLDESPGFRAPRMWTNSTTSAFEDESHRTAEFEISTAEASRTKKRPSFTPVNQPTIPRVVNTVDNRASFNYFHAGWILPADQKRGGRAPISQQSQPTTQLPPRKKQKIDHGDSKVSVVDTSMEEQHSSDNEEVIDERRSVSRAVSVTDGIDVPHKVLTQPNGTVIIEKLDTPAIRRERFMRRKAEKQKLAETSVPTDSTQRQGTTRVHSVSKSVAEDEKLPTHDTFEDESDLSELSEEESQALERHEVVEEEEELPVKRTSTSTQHRKSAKKTVPKVDQYPESTIVWAKSESFPWWPAVVYSETSSQVPKNVLEVHKQKKQKRKIKLYIVQFYDKTDSWQSVPRERLRMLGEDNKLDEEMLGSNAKQKWKAAASKKDCREAYRRALAEMDVADNSEA